MRVLLAPHGTRGDIQPMLALATALRARGHAAVFVVPSNFLEWIHACGFEAVSNGVDMEAAMRAPDAKLESLRWLFGRLREQTAQMFEPVSRASKGADLILGAGAQLVTASVAEWRDVPHANIAFCPCAIPSGGTPPPTVRTQAFPPWANRLLWQVGGSIADFGLRGTINRGRATLGLRPIDSPLTHIAENRVILAADRDLAPLGDDAPETAVSTDAWIFDGPQTPDPRVEAFLNLDPAPVYVGFGSMVSHRAAVLSAHAVDAARAVGRRLILVGGWAGLDRFVTDADDVLAVRAVSHEAVLPRVALAVHHGGAGTTTAAARAGVPQVILPHILDQFYWAHRIERLGLGPRALAVDLITADILTARIDTALHDARIRARAAALGPVIAARNGVAAAVDHLGRLVAVHDRRM
jgi:UDP:flavonoid glycosyltransferase YjiC (YdhE family)